MVYLAMTAAEMQNCSKLPDHIAWMACHFSPYGTGLSNIPTSLPQKSLLILNDRTPIFGHDPLRIAETLRETVEKSQCCGILLDFQRPNQQETIAIVDQVLTLPWPVCVAQPYAKNRDCPILLPPVPLLKTAEEYLKPWQGREIWLELALDSVTITVTEIGSQTTTHGANPQNFPHFDEELLVHYGYTFDQKRAVFTLKRTESDQQKLQKEAEKWGAVNFVGLWQEFGK